MGAPARSIPETFPARSTSSCRKPMFASTAGATLEPWVWCWSICCDDRNAGPHADLDRCRSDRPTAWLHRLECDGADEAGTRSLFGTCFRFSWPPRRSDQTDLVGWRRAMSLREETGTWTLRVAAGYEWHGLSHPGAAVHAAGRD